MYYIVFFERRKGTCIRKNIGKAWLDPGEVGKREAMVNGLIKNVSLPGAGLIFGKPPSQSQRFFKTKKLKRKKKLKFYS
jgi:hypothetical protein